MVDEDGIETKRRRSIPNPMSFDSGGVDVNAGELLRMVAAKEEKCLQPKPIGESGIRIAWGLRNRVIARDWGIGDPSQPGSHLIMRGWIDSTTRGDRGNWEMARDVEVARENCFLAMVDMMVVMLYR